MNRAALGVVGSAGIHLVEGLGRLADMEAQASFERVLTEFGRSRNSAVANIDLVSSGLAPLA